MVVTLSFKIDFTELCNAIAGFEQGSFSRTHFRITRNCAPATINEWNNFILAMPHKKRRMAVRIPRLYQWLRPKTLPQTI